MSEKIKEKVAPGVATGQAVQDIFRIAKANRFALPAVNVIGTDSVNGVMEAAKAVNSPVIIQFSVFRYSSIHIHWIHSPWRNFPLKTQIRCRG